MKLTDAFTDPQTGESTENMTNPCILTKRKIDEIKLETTDYDPGKNCSPTSVIKATFITFGGPESVLVASGSHCGYLAEILTKHIVPNLA